MSEEASNSTPAVPETATDMQTLKALAFVRDAGGTGFITMGRRPASGPPMNPA